MKTTTFNTVRRNIFSAAMAIVITSSLYSCSRKISFLTSPVVPAARGTVQVKKDKNNNYSIQIHMFNLAEVKRLDPPKQTYVVWMETDDQNIIKNIGQINSSTGTLTKKLKASFQTVSSFKPHKIFITAEEEGSVQQPGIMVVLSTDHF